MSRSAAAMLADQPREVIVHAAGGMIVRRSSDGEVQVAIVHRPERLDWSFPKGKLEPGESFEECAVREVAEETGFTCRLGSFVGHTEYRDRKDRPKVVAYWIMEVESGEFSSGREVDELRWVDIAGAAHLLTYERDHELLVALGAAVHDLFADHPGGPDLRLVGPAASDHDLEH
ncbi:MAG TPA: NUDIX hydrolase [Acidimicrobiales bacterium]|jgi:8-oxo-dGTP diphosphatase|nr:NUDIX hydrolase [Acidimicrobiales bacterium]